MLGAISNAITRDVPNRSASFSWSNDAIYRRSFDLPWMGADCGDGGVRSGDDDRILLLDLGEVQTVNVDFALVIVFATCAIFIAVFLFRM